MKIGYDAKRIFHNTTGLGNYCRDSVRIMADYFSENKYYLYNPKPGKVKRLKVTDVMIICLPKSSFWRKYSSIWRQKAIVKDLIADGVELYHGLTNELPRGIDKTKIKSIVTIHDLIFVRYPKLYGFFERIIHLNKFKYSAGAANVVIAISEQTKKDIVEFLNISPKKIKVVYQGCHAAFKKEYSNKLVQEVVNKYKLPKQFILNVGTIEPRKNALSIVKAIRETNEHLILVGRETKYAEKIHEYIKNNKMNNRIHFLKNVSMEELAVVYQLADVFVYPSVFEGFGIPIIEALYSKTPVISSKGSCFSEAGGPHSKYVNANNINELSTMIQCVLKSESLKKEMVINGYNYVQKFNDEVIASQLMEVYKNL